MIECVLLAVNAMSTNIAMTPFTLDTRAAMRMMSVSTPYSIARDRCSAPREEDVRHVSAHQRPERRDDRDRPREHLELRRLHVDLEHFLHVSREPLVDPLPNGARYMHRRARRSTPRGLLAMMRTTVPRPGVGFVSVVRLVRIGTVKMRLLRRLLHDRRHDARHPRGDDCRDPERPPPVLGAEC
jgi:hypothetical protein